MACKRHIRVTVAVDVKNGTVTVVNEMGRCLNVVHDFAGVKEGSTHYLRPREVRTLRLRDVRAIP